MGVRSRMLKQRIRDNRLLVGRHNWGKYNVWWSHFNRWRVQRLDSIKAQIIPEMHVAQIIRNNSLWQTRLGFFHSARLTTYEKRIRVPGRQGSMLETPYYKNPYLLCFEWKKIGCLPDHLLLTVGKGFSLVKLKNERYAKILSPFSSNSLKNSNFSPTSPSPRTGILSQILLYNLYSGNRAN